MRKHDVRKWLHAILDLLPVLVIPLFMIYSSNKNYQSNLAIDVPKYENVRFNQIIQLPDNVTTNTSFATFTYDSTNITVNVNVNNNSGGSVWQSGLRLNNVNLVTDDIYLITFKTTYSGVLYNQLNDSSQYNNNGVERYLRLQKASGGTAGLIGFPDNLTGSFDVIDLNIFNLTYMYGVGNEPSYDEFRNVFSDPYYSYQVRNSVLITNGSVHYEDSDIGSQMFYTLYNSTNKYFNLGDVFGLNGVYQWFVVNIMNSNFNPALFVVWQIVLYEFVMDLLFLLYGLFMWFIDMIQKLMEKPLNSIK